MNSIRKWLYKPKKDDKSLLAQFFYADEDLNIVANELDSFDGRKDPERCTILVNQLRQAQDKVLTITNAIMDVLIGDERANRDFRVKFPEDVLQDNLAGQLWFGAECLAAGSSIMNRETESTEMRPLAKAVTKSLENVRNLLRNACLRHNTPNGPIKLDSNELVTEVLLESLKIFDKLFAEFELAYVSAMVPVKSTQEYELQEMIGVLFSETLHRALKMKILTQDMVDDCDPALMFTIPRLAIVSGLLIFPNGPLCIDKSVDEMSEMFRPFRTLLHKIRELLLTLNKRELYMLEKLLCDNEQISDVKSMSDAVGVQSDLDEFVSQFYQEYTICGGDDPVTANNTIPSANHTIAFATKPKPKETRVPDTNTTTHHGSTSSTSNNIVDLPSTSNCLIPINILNNTIITAANTTHSNHSHYETPPDHDSLEIISEAAATLSSILTTDKNICDNKNLDKKINADIESPNDSGICTETTSLDRSPSLELNEATNASLSNGKKSQQTSKKKQQLHPQRATSSPPPQQPSSRLIPKSIVPLRKQKLKNGTILEGVSDEDTSTSSGSSETSSFNSNSVDDEELAMAMQAAEITNRNEIRSKYRSSEDLLHRLFVCIAGVADQLQTNFASDLRNILKGVFLINTTSSDNTTTTQEDTLKQHFDSTSLLDASIEYHPTENDVIEHNEFSVDPNILAQEALFDTNVYFHLDNDNTCPSDYTNHPRQIQVEEHSYTADYNRYANLRDDIAQMQSDNAHNATATESANQYNNARETILRPPVWIPDIEAPKCMSCGANFTVVKRRHHCRNCGKVFCARCSSNTVPLPKYGHVKPVRVCNKCFIYNLHPFT